MRLPLRVVRGAVAVSDVALVGGAMTPGNALSSQYGPVSRGL